MIRSRQTRTEKRGHSGGEEVTEEDAGFDVRQLCVRKPPGGAVEVGVLEPLLDLVQQVPARGAVRNMIAGRAAFVLCRVELANDATFTVRHVPDEGARVIDAELDGLDADFVPSE